MGRVKRSFAYKQFHYLGGISENLIFGAAIVDLRWLCTGFFYVYDLKSKREIRHTWRSPFSGNVSFSENPEAGPVRFGSETNGIFVECVDGKRVLNVRRHGKSLIQASLEDRAPAIEPLRICTRAGYTGWVYVRKTGGVRMTGEIDCELGQFDASQCLGHTDYSTGFMRPETWWNWAFISALVDGKPLGINVSCGVNETSYSENCCWIDGKLHAMPQTRFEFDPRQPTGDWRIESTALDLKFQAAGLHKEHVNAGILASRFSQLYGRFSGSLAVPGLPTSIQAMGFVEDHYAKW